MKNLPIVYIASPYSQGDTALNVRSSMLAFDNLLSTGWCVPICPLWTHFQHLVFPREYESWLNYELALIARLAQSPPVAIVRVNASDPKLDYHQEESTGADREVMVATALGIPVFHSLPEVVQWCQEHVQPDLARDN